MSGKYEISKAGLMGYLLQEVVSEHSDKSSSQYNGCDKEPCCFCARAKYLIAVKPSFYTQEKEDGYIHPIDALRLLIYECENQGRFVDPHPDIGVSLVTAVKPLVLYDDIHGKSLANNG